MLALMHAAALAQPAASPSQLLVLGMHHSGTSIVSNLTMMMGAYGGEMDELLLHPENPLKYWERRDVVALDEQRLTAGVSARVSERYDVPEWIAYGFDAGKAATKVHEMPEAKAVVAKLNMQRPWVTKDPRMCLVADEWMELLDAPLCVIVHREPLSVANSMMIYSHNVSLAEWASVYEAYYTNAMRACHGVRASAFFLWPPLPAAWSRVSPPPPPARPPSFEGGPPSALPTLLTPPALAPPSSLQKPTVVVQHAELVANPFAATVKLYNDLVAAGVAGLTLPTEAQVGRLLRPSTEHAHTYLASERAAVGPSVHALSMALSSADRLPAAQLPRASWHVAERKESEAIATLLTTDNRDYLRGALVLGSSIRSFDSSRDMVRGARARAPLCPSCAQRRLTRSRPPHRPGGARHRCRPEGMARPAHRSRLDSGRGARAG